MCIIFLSGNYWSATSIHYLHLKKHIYKCSILKKIPTWIKINVSFNELSGDWLSWGCTRLPAKLIEQADRINLQLRMDVCIFLSRALPPPPGHGMTWINYGKDKTSIRHFDFWICITKNITYTQLGKTSRNAARIYGSHREDILEFRLWIYYTQQQQQQQLLSLPAGCVSEMMHSSRFGRKPTPMLPSSHGSLSGTWQPSSTLASQRQQQLSQIICAHDMGASPARDNPKFAYRATFAWNTACGRCGTGVAWQTKMR